MAGLVDSGNAVVAEVVSLARELSDPVRLTALQVLAAEGPHTMVQLAEVLGVSAPRLGNHLAKLRAAGMVTAERAGRHAMYRVRREDLTDLLTALAHYAHGEHGDALAERPATAADIAHTCYDHTAGRLGVAVFTVLVNEGALLPPDGRRDELALGDDLSAFRRLGVDPSTVDAGRRKVATACLDRTHRVPHLGGVLGRLVLDVFVAEDLVEPREGTRELRLTAQGARRLPALLPGFSPT